MGGTPNKFSSKQGDVRFGIIAVAGRDCLATIQAAAAIDSPIRPLAAFLFPTQFPPFLAGAKVPSMNASGTSR